MNNMHCWWTESIRNGNFHLNLSDKENAIDDIKRAIARQMRSWLTKNCDFANNKHTNDINVQSLQLSG